MFQVNKHTKADIVEDNVEIVQYNGHKTPFDKVKISRKELLEIADMIRKEM
ncbi:hypothetical protein [Ectobacillus panaciterrae]|uniref:hypothetical protein n=1 Tax=Ectobacillus panaciterrae TaxID=363872 RepID=UPI0003FF59CE|nr:hypothetical protein [Ectobacillus panaciterrae]